MAHPAIGTRKEELDTPVLLVDLDALERNIARTAARLREAGVAWRPHTKGQKVPEIARLEVAAGAIGVTCAKLGEAEVMVDAGIGSVLIANQIVGPQKVERLANLNRRAEVIVAVDCPEHVRELDAAGRRHGLRLPVVIEVDIGIARCGVQPGANVVELARAIVDSPGLRFMGVMGWEGQTRRELDPAARRPLVEAAVGELVASAEACRAAGIPVEIVSCGGTGTEEFSSRIPGVTEIQAGGIVFNDAYYHRLGLDRDFALTVLSRVVSRATPTRIVTDAGKKALSVDNTPPQPLSLPAVSSIALSAEHGKIELVEPSERPQVGETVEWLVGYSDTTVCLHDEMYALRGGRVEAVWSILGRGKLR